MDNDLLKQLILRHRRVVIPEFGAFIKKEDTDGDILVFSPFLRKDDGVVTDAIVRGYGVETDDARAMVSEFVLYLKQALASGRYYIEGVGMLVSDANGTIVLKEHETPMIDIVSAEPIPEPVVQPIQQVAQPVQQVQQPIPQAAQGVTRAQSIQVQTSAPPPVQSFPGILQQQQQQPMMPSQKRSSMPQGGYSGIQQPIRAQYQPPRSPMLSQQPQFQQRPVSGPPMDQQHMRGQQPIPQQPMQGQSIVPPMPQQSIGGGIPPRGQRDPRRAEMPNEEHTRQNDGGEQQRRQRSPQRRRKPPKQKTKADVWLIVAIIAAMAVIILMVFAVITDKSADSMDMINDAMSPVTAPAVVDTSATSEGL